MITSEIDIEFFNLTNIIALKLHECERNKKNYLFFIIANSNKSLKIECIEFDTINQFDGQLYFQLKGGFIFSRLENEMILLENIFLKKNLANQGKIIHN